MIISLEYVYYICGILMAIVSLLAIQDKSNPKRFLTAAFWGIFAVSFLFGKVIPPLYMGVLVIVMAVIAGFGGVRLGSYEKSTD